MELLKFYAHSFCRSCGLVTQIHAFLETSRQSNGLVTPVNEVWGALGDALGDLQRECERLELTMSLALLRRIKAMVDETHGPLNYFSFISPLHDLQTRIVDELESRLFVSVPPREARMYEEPRNSWGNVPDMFPRAVVEIEEASKCLALARSTAAVFHLMRVLETALSAIARALNVTQHSPTWNAYLTAFRAAIDYQYPDKDKSALNQEMRSFYAHAEAQLRTVKDAWRNPTMHRIENVYTPETALDVYNAVRAFMRVLATKISDV